MDDDDWCPEFEPKFQHISWFEIADAELSGDQEAIQKLMDKSQEIKQQKALEKLPATPIPPTTPIALSTPTENLPFSEFLDTDETDANSRANQSLPASLTTPKSTVTFRKPSSTYADIARGSKVGIRGTGKAGKRKMVERVGLSPIDIPTKRTALTTPSTAPVQHNTPLVTQVVLEEPAMEMNTPDVDKPVRVGVQRRLFDTNKTSPHRSQSTSPWQLKDNDSVLDDNHRLTQRQKQIDFGKNTSGYEIYLQTIPKWKRSRNDPWTPDKHRNCSTRAWQGQIRVWRRALHKYDPPMDEELPLSHDESYEVIEESVEEVKKEQFTVQDAAICALLDIDENSIDMKY